MTTKWFIIAEIIGFIVAGAFTYFSIAVKHSTFAGMVLVILFIITTFINLSKWEKHLNKHKMNKDN